MAGKRINPPKLKDGDDYDEWAREIEIWQMVTEIPKEKQGAMIYLSLEGQARQCCKSVPTTKLQGENGVTELMLKLKTLFAKDSEQAAFKAYEQFETYMRPEGMEMIEFINEWERRYAKISEKNMTLPDGVLGYRLLKSANISDICQTMVRTSISKLCLEDVKKQLKAVHDKTIVGDSSSAAAIKVEPAMLCEEEEEFNEVYYTNNRGYRGRGGRGRYRGNGSTQRYTEKDKLERDGKQFQKQEVKKRKNSVNPPDRIGNPSKCAVCHSIMHWASQCPHKEEEVTLYTSKEIESQCFKEFMRETFNSAILDSGCSKTVCGEEWLKSYISSLSEKEVSRVEEQKSVAKFRFGDGKAYTSLKQVKIPARIGRKSIYVETDVVTAEIPMLLSKGAMKKANAKLDFVHDKIEMFGEQIELKFTSSGHYMIDLKPFSIEDVKENISLLSLTEATAKKLHTQFGHAPTDRLIDLIRNSGIEDKKFLKLVEDTEKNCETCKRYKKQKPRPVVALSLAKGFNEVVSVDLKDVEKEKVFHIVDNATRYSGGALVTNKSKEEIVDKFFMNWIKIFGCPKKLLSDNGREFNNELFKEMASLLGVELLSTAAESPWSNGITERHNALIGTMMTKILEETKCSKEVALAWSFSAKNSLTNVYGFSPNQLAFGHNPNFPALIDSSVATAEGSSSSKLIADHLNAMHAARKAFVENESSDKFRRAISKQTRTSTVLTYEQGDKVYFKRKNCKRWQGPGHVIGKDKNQVFVKHGGEFYRVSSIDIQPAEQKVVQSQDKKLKKSVKQESEEEEEDDDEDDDEYLETSEQERKSQDEKENCEETNKDELEENEVNKENIEETNVGELVEVEVNVENIDAEENVEARDNLQNPTLTDGTMPGKGSKIRYKLADSETWEIATVIGRAGKAGGKHQYWSNIRKEDSDSSIHMKDLDAWEYVDEEVLISSSMEIQEVVKAKMIELENLKRHEVYEEMPYADQVVIQTTWVISESTKNGITAVKARLVAKGFQENEEIRKDSPTCLKTSLRLTFCVAASNKWTVKVLDIKSAFLQGRDIDREVYVKPPVEAGKGIVWRLKKTIYGLNDASRKWYLRIKGSLEKYGAKMSIYDEALFFYYQEKVLSGLVCLHVDDFFHCGTSKFNQYVISKVKEEFEISKEAERSFSYVGLEVDQKDDGLHLSQKTYIEKLEVIDLSANVNKQDSLTEEQKKKLRSLIGQLAWTSSQTRPDVAFDVCQLSVNFKNATVKDLMKANKCVKKLKSENVILKFPDLGDLKKAKLVAYADASFNNLGNGASQGANICFIVGENGKHAVISWQSKKIQRVVKSTLGAETMALMTGVENCILFSAVVNELYQMSINLPVYGVTDSKSLFDAVYSSKTLEDSRLKIDVAVLRDYLRKNEVKEIGWVATVDQLADALTKSGASTKKLVEAIQDVDVKLYIQGQSS